MADAWFTTDMLGFLAELEMNNERAWFLANKAAYETLVREPALRFIDDMVAPLAKISRNFVADPRKAGGSLMRIHRDVRFSTDKRPYKTNVCIQFRHKDGKDAHAPGFYLHIAPDGCFVGLGTWHPPPDALAAIRAHIIKSGAAWTAAHRDLQAAKFAPHGDALTRAPRGFDPAEPLIELIKYKDHIATKALSVKQITGRNLPDLVATQFAAGASYMKVLCKALSVAF